ncbi:MAG: hypothetical protein ACFFAO_06385 [Candidatus Hermodarchaeota archaeon]
MIKCPYCKKDSYKSDVCTECGVVFQDRLLVNESEYIKKKKGEDLTKPLYNEFFSPLSPDFEYRHKYPRWSKNSELNRALKRQKLKWNKSKDYFYKRDHTEINRICAYLQLPSVIRNEALNIRLQIDKIEENYFKRRNKYKLTACVRLACKIHDYPIDIKELVQLINGFPPINNEDLRMKGNPYKRTMDKEYMGLQEKLKIFIDPFPKNTSLISYACKRLGLNQDIETECYNEYDNIKIQFKSQYSLKGYVLALIYLICKKEKVKIRLTDLEEGFGVSRTTISSRIDDIEYIWNWIKIGQFNDKKLCRGMKANV